MKLEYVPRDQQNHFTTLDRPRPSGIRTVIFSFLAWQMIWALIFGGTIAAIWYGAAPVLAILTGATVLVLLPAVASSIAEVRRGRGNVILTYLDQAVRLNLPLPRLLDAAQRSEQRGTALRLRALRDLLEDGAPLDLALPAAVPEIPARKVSLIAAAERLGQLRKTLDRLVKTSDAGIDQDNASRNAFARWYPLLMTLAVSFVLTTLLAFAMPRIQNVFNDFNMRLPYPSTVLMRLSRSLNDWDPLGRSGSTVIIFVLIALGIAFRRIVSVRARGARFAWFDEILWRLPIIHGLQKNNGLADAFHTIADAMSSGYSLPRAIEEAATLRMNSVLRNRFRKWGAAIQGGAPADQAARDAALPALVCGMIGSGRGGEPSAAMDFLASYYEDRFSRSRELLQAAIVPAVAIFFGAIVIFVASGTYLPLLQLMDQLDIKALQVSK
jgi:type II secretory pathway component PulF